MRVEAHIHIGRKRKGIAECMSVRALPNGKVGYWSNMHLSNVSFAVQPAGLRRFRETGQKNVHAYVRGTTESKWNAGTPWREVVYNPNVHDSFVDKELGFPVHKATRCFFDGNRLFYVNE